MSNDERIKNKLRWLRFAREIQDWVNYVEPSNYDVQCLAAWALLMGRFAI